MDYDDELRKNMLLINSTKGNKREIAQVQLRDFGCEVHALRKTL
jgi:hypothetical protein